MAEIVTITMKYDPEAAKLTSDEWRSLGAQMSFLVAVVLKTAEHRLIASTDIDFIYVAYPAGYIAQKIAIKIETIGYSERKAKVTRAKVLALKDDFLGHFKRYNIDFDTNKPLISLEYLDPDSHYV